MKKYQLCGIGNAIVDILIKISEQEFSALGYEKGTMNLIDHGAQAELIRKLQMDEPVLAAGGSVANSIVTFAELGGRAAFTGCFGDDRYGLFYNSSFEDYGVELTQKPIVNASTGTCLSLITPDSERTMRTYLGASQILDANHISAQVIKDSEWIFLEGYLFSNPEKGYTALTEAVKTAKECNTRIALTFSDSWVIDTFREEVRAAARQADLVFANETEAMSYTGCNNKQAAFAALAGEIPIVVMTAGADGAYFSDNGEQQHVPAYPASPVDMTGAGDAFAGAFLYGLITGEPVESTMKAACFLASRVISQVGARLQSGVRQAWDECVSSA